MVNYLAEYKNTQCKTSLGMKVGLMYWKVKMHISYKVMCSCLLVPSLQNKQD